MESRVQKLGGGTYPCYPFLAFLGLDFPEIPAVFQKIVSFL